MEQKEISKYASYSIEQRMDDLKCTVKLQCSPGNYDANEYMLGMANGLLLAQNIICEPYGSEINYLKIESKKSDT